MLRVKKSEICHELGQIIIPDLSFHGDRC